VTACRYTEIKKLPGKAEELRDLNFALTYGLSDGLVVEVGVPSFLFNFGGACC